jgi:multiple antibiotic resistance protein
VGEPSLSELILTLLVGLGPFKASLIFMSMAEDEDVSTRRRMALAAVGTACGGALALLFLGAALQSFLHFSLGALSVSGGIILLVLAVRVVLGIGEDDSEGHEDKDPVEKAISPLGTPLMLSPIGIVALVTFSAEVKTMQGTMVIAAVIVGVALLDLVALLVAARLSHVISHALVTVLEKLFTILVAALAVQLVVDGLADLGIIAEAVH